MKRHILSVFVFLTLILVLGSSSLDRAYAVNKGDLIWSGESKVLTDQFLDVSQLKRGMKGYGLSVFSGSKPIRFGAEIIGVMNDGPKNFLILARFSGKVLEKTGVIAGMSGSPVYINGKLIGAVSHAFPWAKEPVGAIRPIMEMLEVLKKPSLKPSLEPIHFIPLETELRNKLISLDRKSYRRRGTYDRIATIGNRQITLRPVRTPILFSGIDDRVLNVIRPELESYGLYPMRGGSGGRMKPPKGVSRELNPGDAVGIQLISGDMTATPVGTVTYRKGNKILMFGHPNFFKGPVDMPMTKEYIHTVIANREVSFKMSSTLFEVGRAYEDRKVAVAGELGKYSSTIPVKVIIHDEGKKEVFNFRIVKDNVFFPNLLSTCIMQSALNVNSKIANTSIKFQYKIRVKNLDTGKIDTVTTNDFMTGNVTEKNMFQGLFRLSLPLQALLYNPFVKTEILDVETNLSISQGWKASELVDVRLLKTTVHAGDELPILVTLKTFQGKRIYKKLSIKLPDIINSSVISLGVASAKVEMTLDKAFSLARFVPKNYRHLITILNKNERFNDLVVWVDVPERGLIVNGQEHPDLPSSIQSVMSSGNNKQNVIKGRVKKYYRSNYLIYGMQVLPVTILPRGVK